MADKRQKRHFPLHTLKLTPKMAARHMEGFLLTITQLGTLNIDPQLKGVPEHSSVAAVGQWQRAGSVRTVGISPQAWNQPLTFSRHITVACPALSAFTPPTQPLSHFAPASLARCCSFKRPSKLLPQGLCMCYGCLHLEHYFPDTTGLTLKTFLRSLLNVPSSVQPALTPPNENSTHNHIQTLPTLSSCLIFLHSTHLFIYFFIICLPPDRGLQEGEPSKNIH